LIGATALLSGMARITISLAVILMETTGEAAWSLPIFLTVMAAKWSGDLFNKGIYDIHIDLRHVPLLEGRAEKPMLMVQAEDFMATDVRTMKAVMPVQDVLAILGSCRHNGFPVVDPTSGSFVGMVERNTLHNVLLIGEANNFEGTVSYQQMLELGHPGYPPLDEVQRAIGPDRVEEINILPYTNQGCYTVQGDAAAMRCYRLFRTMGLRHLPVIAEDHSLRGIITRKDLLNAMETTEGHGLRELSLRKVAVKKEGSKEDMQQESLEACVTQLESSNKMYSELRAATDALKEDSECNVATTHSPSSSRRWRLCCPTRDAESSSES